MQLARYAREKHISWSEANAISIDDFAFWLAHGSLEPSPDPMILNAINCRAIYGSQGHDADMKQFILAGEDQTKKADKMAGFHAVMKAKALHERKKRERASE
ncbi:hypothetical protein [Lacunimicrobium album]